MWVYGVGYGQYFRYNRRKAELTGSPVIIPPTYEQPSHDILNAHIPHRASAKFYKNRKQNYKLNTFLEPNKFNRFMSVQDQTVFKDVANHQFTMRKRVESGKPRWL